MSTNQAVILLYFNPLNKDEVLSVSRKDDHTSYGLPGGKVDAEETYLASLVREIEEEVGVTIPSHKCSFTYQAICSNFDTITYLLDDIPDLPSLPFINEEGAMVSFQPISNLINKDHSLFAEYNLNLFKVLNNDLDYIHCQK